MVIDFDDFGVNHVISPECQTHDCRDKLDSLHYLNPSFKVTLFAVPAEMSLELLEWCKANESWIQLAVHGWKHSDNWEASKWTKEECLQVLNHEVIKGYFVKGFKAPGWQISDGCYEALVEEGFWVADQGYNDGRRPKVLKAYVNYDGDFGITGAVGMGLKIDAWHGHTWDCVGNGIYETYDQLADKVSKAEEFKFISELFE